MVQTIYSHNGNVKVMRGYLLETRETRKPTKYFIKLMLIDGWYVVNAQCAITGQWREQKFENKKDAVKAFKGNPANIIAA